MKQFIHTYICKVEETRVVAHLGGATEQRKTEYTKLFRYIPYCLSRLAQGISQREGKIITVELSNENNTVMVIVAYEAKEEVPSDWVNEHIPKD